MITVIQVVTHANVIVNKIEIGAISKGILALIGIEKTDTFEQAKKLMDRVINYRIFADENGKTNLSLKDIHGGLLLVPQFTLVAETNKGTRPGFSLGMPSEEGQKLFANTVQYAKEIYAVVATGEFGADMKVNLCNDGPMTFWLRV